MLGLVCLSNRSMSSRHVSPDMLLSLSRPSPWRTFVLLGAHLVFALLFAVFIDIPALTREVFCFSCRNRGSLVCKNDRKSPSAAESQDDVGKICRFENRRLPCRQPSSAKGKESGRCGSATSQCISHVTYSLLIPATLLAWRRLRPRAMDPTPPYSVAISIICMHAKLVLHFCRNHI